MKRDKIGDEIVQLQLDVNGNFSETFSRIAASRRCSIGLTVRAFAFGAASGVPDVGEREI